MNKIAVEIMEMRGGMPAGGPARCFERLRDVAAGLFLSPLRRASIMKTGTIRMVSRGRDFGFVKPDDGSTDTFIHIRDAQASGIAELLEGTRIRYAEQLDQRSGKYRAVELQVL